MKKINFVLIITLFIGITNCTSHYESKYKYIDGYKNLMIKWEVETGDDHDYINIIFKNNSKNDYGIILIGKIKYKDDDFSSDVVIEVDKSGKIIKSTDINLQKTVYDESMPELYKIPKGKVVNIPIAYFSKLQKDFNLSKSDKIKLLIEPSNDAVIKSDENKEEYENLKLIRNKISTDYIIM